LTYMHVFSYSPRPGTPASGWKQVDERVKKERAIRLRELSKRKNRNFRNRLQGNVWEGVVIKRVNGGASILTSNFVQVHVSSCPTKVRERVSVKITNAKDDTTQGLIVV